MGFSLISTTHYEHKGRTILNIIKGSLIEFSLLAQVLSSGEGSEGEEQAKCICVNPGRLAKGEGGGTFAELNYRGGPDTTNTCIIGI